MKPADNPTPSKTLRDRAEEMIRTAAAEVAGMSTADLRRLVHELRIRQKELEIQNEDLRRGQIELAQAHDHFSDVRQQLEESEQRYRRLTDAVTDYIYRVRVEWGQAVETVHGANSAAVTGYTPEEFRANPLLWIAMVPPEDRAVVEQQVRCILADQQAPPIEHRIVRKEGEVRWVLNTVSPQHDEQGRLIAYDGLVRDITERKAAEEALRQLNETLEQRVAEQTREVKLLAEAMANLGEGVLITSDRLNWPGPKIVYANAAMCRITGYQVEELIGQTPRILQGEKTDTSTIQRLRQKLAENRSHLCELVNYRKDGTPYDAELFVSPLIDAAGHHTNFIAVHRDITERKRAEQALRASEARTSAILASLSAHIAVVDRTGRIVAVNPAWERFARDNQGLAERCNVGADYLEVCRTATCLYGDEAPVVAAGIRSILEEGKDAFSLEYPCHSDSEQRWFILHATPLRSEQGGAVVSHMNISDRIEAEQRLRASEERMRAVLNAAADAIITIDRRGRIDGVNPATERMFGYTQQELVGQAVDILMPPPYRDEHDDYIARYLQTGEPRLIGIGRDVAGRRKDGSTFPIGLAVSEVNHSGLFIGIIRDNSERNELQKQVLEIAAEEDRRIGHELHDNIQQQLTGLGLLARSVADTLAAAHDQDPGFAERSGILGITPLAMRVAKGIDQSARHVHLLSRGLVPVEVDAEGLRSSLTDLAARIGEQYSVDCRFRCDGPVEMNDNFTATHLYRIAQEAVNNSLKHAQADRIDVSLAESNDTITLNVLDNGIGIRDQRGRGPGMGLHIMEYRAGLIGATLHIGRGENGGTLLSCTILRGA